MEKRIKTTTVTEKVKKPEKNGSMATATLPDEKFQAAKRKVLTVHERLLRRLAE